MAIKIATDTCADLSPAEVKEMGITVVPLVVAFGEEGIPECDLSREEFWRRTEGPVHPTTSQPSVGSFATAFEALVREGHEVICLTITSEHSGTYSSALTAARDFGDAVTVVDSRYISYGLGWQVQEAYAAAQRGLGIPEIVGILDDMRERTGLFIVLGTIDFLERGGRAAALMPVLKKALRFLKIKPVLAWKDGQLQILGMARSFERGVDRMLQEIRAMGPLERVAAFHTRLPERAQKLAAELAQITGIPLGQIPARETGAALSAHGGPGLVAAMGVRKRESTD